MVAISDRLAGIAGIAGIAERYGLRDIYVFGSRAGEIAARSGGRELAPAGNDDSDVDIAVQPIEGHHLDARARVRLIDDLDRTFAAPWRRCSTWGGTSSPSGSREQVDTQARQGEATASWSNPS
jgi:predicted nucleotidyltransferase